MSDTSAPTTHSTTPRDTAAVLAELTAVEALRRRLQRRRDDLAVEAAHVGVTQAAIAQRLTLSQASVSRHLQQVQRTATRDRAIADAVDAHELGELTDTEFVETLIDAGEGPTPALERAITRGTISPGLLLAAQTAWRADLTERERLERLDPDALAERMRTTVADALARLRATGADDERRAALARRARATRASQPKDRVDILLEARAILEA